MREQVGVLVGTRNGASFWMQVAKCWARSFGRVNSKDFHTWVLPRQRVTKARSGLLATPQVAI